MLNLPVKQLYNTCISLVELIIFGHIRVSYVDPCSGVCIGKCRFSIISGIECYGGMNVGIVYSYRICFQHPNSVLCA